MLVDDLSVFIPTCAIPSNPSTELIERVIDSIRFHLPTQPIYLYADGVAKHIAPIPGRIPNYVQFNERCRRLCSDKWTNVHYCRFERWEHQAGMFRAALRAITTRFILFWEHDVWFRTDRPACHWETILSVLADGTANIVRLPHWEEGIWPEHAHLNVGEFTRDGVRFVRTLQFSGWPFLLTADFAKNMMFRIPVDTPTFLEVYLYESAMTEPNYYKMAMYVPGFPNQRFMHLNGRAGDPSSETW